MSVASCTTELISKLLSLPRWEGHCGQKEWQACGQKERQGTFPFRAGYLLSSDSSPRAKVLNE